MVSPSFAVSQTSNLHGTRTRVSPGQPRERLRATLKGPAPKTLGVLGLLAVALPINLAITGLALLRKTKQDSPQDLQASGQTILITGGKMTKALHLARCFHRAGHRVILAESEKYRLTGHRFSRDVDQFHATPTPGAVGYIEAIAQIVAQEHVDLWVPVSSPASSVFEAEAAAELGIPVVHGKPEIVRRLDDKEELVRMAGEAGLPVPEAHRITDPAQVAPLVDASTCRYILKSIAYDPLHRLDLTPLPRATRELTEAFAYSKPITAETPWVLEELLDGEEICTHATAIDGVVRLHVCCDSSAFQVNYEHLDRPEVEAWVAQFVAHHRITGQISFDFIIDESGTVRPIECNPRTHSAITVCEDYKAVAQAYLNTSEHRVLPGSDARSTYWLYHELWRMMADPRRIPERLKIIAAGHDAIFDWEDPLPFLLVHHLQIPALLLARLRSGKDWIRIDFNIGKLVETGGD